MKRREFPKAVKVEIVKRATHVDERGRSQIYCEGCGLATTRFEIDHTIPDALQVDKSKPLTAEDGKLLCAGSPESCHARKTTETDRPMIDKAKRVEAGHMRVNAGLGPLAVPAAVRKARREAQSKDGRGDKLPVPPPHIPPGFVPATER